MEEWKRFRKTFATILEQAGNDVVVVESAGGKNVTMAQRHYIGKSQKYLRQVVDEGFYLTQLARIASTNTAG